MKLTKDSAKIVNHVKRLTNNGDIPILNNNVVFTDIFQKMYNNYYLTENTKLVIDYEKKRPRQNMIPVVIRNKLNAYKHCYSFQLTVQNNTICTVHMFFDKSMDQKDLASMTKKIIVAIKLISAYSRSYTERLDIEIIFTEFKKMLPSHALPLDEQHINSAFVMNCTPRKIMTIFRREEWYKVLIHELLHAFNIDFSCKNQTEIDIYMNSLFPIKKDNFRLFETYTELWAIMIHCCCISFYEAKDKKDIYGLFNRLKFLFSHECKFSEMQFSKIMNYYRLTLSDIGTDTHYVEKTHVLSYFIFKYFCMLNINHFVTLCSSGNTKVSFAFGDSNDKSRQFIDLVYQSYILLMKSDSTSLESYKTKSDFISTTMRMSAYELI